MCVSIKGKRQRTASLGVQRRRQHLIALLHVVSRFSVCGAANALGVSRWTVERDLDFLRTHDLLTIKRNSSFPFELKESGEEFMRRFQAAHKATKTEA